MQPSDSMGSHTRVSFVPETPNLLVDTPFFNTLSTLNYKLFWLYIIFGTPTMGLFGWYEVQPEFTVLGWKTLFTLSQIPLDSSKFLPANRAYLYPKINQLVESPDVKLSYVWSINKHITKIYFIYSIRPKISVVMLCKSIKFS